MVDTLAQSRIISDRFHWAIAFLLLAYTALVAYWMLLGFGRVEQADYHYNFKPFYTIELFMHLRHSHTKASAINLIGNIAVFVPFGMLIPMALPTRSSFWGRLVRMLIIFWLGDLLLESIQLMTKRGSFDVDDLILNTVGAIGGLLLYHILRAVYLRMNEAVVET